MACEGFERDRAHTPPATPADPTTVPAGAGDPDSTQDPFADPALLRLAAAQFGWSMPDTFAEGVAEALRHGGIPLPGPGGRNGWAPLQSMVNAAPDGIAVVDARGRIALVNAAMERLFRCPAAELVGATVESLVPEARRDGHARMREDFLASPRARSMRPAQDLSARRRDGSEFPADICLSPFVLDGETYVVAAIRDVTQRASQQAELRRSEARFRAIFEGASVGIAILGCDGRIQSANFALGAMLGYSADELVGQVESSFVHSADSRIGAQERAELLSGRRDRCEVERRYVRRDGGIVHLRIHDALVRDAAGAPDFVISVHEDVSEQRRAEQALMARTLDLLQLVGRAANEAPDLESAMKLCIAHVCHSLSWPVGHALVRGPSGNLVPSEHWHLSSESRYGALRDVTLQQWMLGDAPATGLLRAGMPVWLDARPRRSSSPRRRVAESLGLVSRVCVPVLVDDEVVAALEFFSPVPHSNDGGLENAMMRIGLHLGRVVERQRAHDQLEHLALHDGLTGLPNRLLFLDRLQHALARLDRTTLRAAVFFMDVDGLKDVNDTLGHAAGDELLKAVADRLRALVRPEDTIARLGGDEFTLLCEGVTDLEEARVIASRVIEGVAQPLHVRGIEFEPSLSVGLSLVDDPDTPPEAVLREADAAMYAAKEHGGGRLASGASPLEPIRRRGSNRGRALRHAVEQGELCLHYQPCVSLPDPRIVSLEALVRWQHPRRGLLPPRSFIPLAERNGVIEPLGDWVIQHACRQLAEWHGRVPGAAPLAMAVNVSSRQFASGHLVGTVTRALEETRLDPSRLFLEITETVMLEGSHSVLDQLHALRAMGVRLSVDDFGTGYSSLHYLQRLPLEQLKLDRRFIAGLRLERPSQAIVASLIRLAHALDLRVVAEGVELPQQRDELADLGCDFAQGWLFGPPGTAAEIEALLSGGLRPATSDPLGDAGPPPAGRLRLVPGPAHAEVAGPVRRRAAHGGPPR